MNAISIHHLGKKYLLNQEQRSDTLRDSMVQKAKHFRQFLAGKSKSGLADFWALDDVSFDVRSGEAIGIIGKNGAGKSTLLKVLSRITEPTTGRIEIRGRVASLLEVGTGFHPELSGRENIFLNGAILGMTRSEIRQKFDEIVAFAEVERFLDTPVKRYSSGMYVRLAFAVAAHLEPEILIVDEVLAVGDAAFRRKCLGKMQSVASTGRTVLFVSHDIGAISSLTSRCAMLEQGRLVKIGTTEDVVAHYLEQDQSGDTIYTAEPADPANPHLERVEILASEGHGLQAAGKPMQICFDISHETPIQDACFSFQVLDHSQRPVTHAWLSHDAAVFANRKGKTRLRCQIHTTRLNIGHYSLRTFLSEPPGGMVIETLDCICPFEVVRLEEPPLWGWRQDACVYHEDNSWAVENDPS